MFVQSVQRIPESRPITADAMCSGRLFRLFSAYLAKRGVDTRDHLVALGLPADALENENTRFSHAQAVELFRLAVAQSGDRALGLHVAESTQTGDFEVLEYAAGSCSTLGESMRCATRYLVLVHEGAELRLDVDETHAILSFRFSDGLNAVPAVIDFVLSSLLIFGRRFTGMNLRPLVMDFAHAAPDDIAEYQRIFACPVRFNRPSNAMYLPVSALSLRQSRGDSGLHRILVSHADNLLSSTSRQPRFRDRVRAQIAAELCGGNPGIDHVTRKLRVSTRTLHRRLQQEGTTYRKVTDELRRGLALRHLSEDRHTIGEISFMLGFSHVNAFHKAFRRWTNTTPSRFRSNAARS